MKWGPWVYEVINPSLNPTVRPQICQNLSYPCLGKRNRRFLNKKRQFLSLFHLFTHFYSHCYFYFLAPGAKKCLFERRVML
jgi:hypothetical protein